MPKIEIPKQLQTNALYNTANQELSKIMLFNQDKPILRSLETVLA